MKLKFGSTGASFWTWGFLRNCRRVMRPLVDDMPALERRIRRAAQELFDGETDRLVDHQARNIMAMCSLVLAAFRELRADTGDSGVAFDAVRRAFAVTYPAPLTWLVRIWTWFQRDPVRSLQREGLIKRQGERMYGQSMQFAAEATDDSAEMLVTRCAFHEYFVRHGAPELTVLVCAWDRSWMDAINRSRRGLRTERPSTISTGGDCCRFRFIRDDNKAGKPDNDIVLVELQTREDRPMKDVAQLP